MSVYRVSFERLVKQSIEFEILADGPEAATKIAERAFHTVPPGDWHTDNIGAPTRAGCDPVPSAPAKRPFRPASIAEMQRGN
jgi:hypothetical protein